MNIGVYVSFQIRDFSRYMPRDGNAGSYGNFIFSFLRNYILHSDYQFTFLSTYRSIPFLHTLSSV